LSTNVRFASKPTVNSGLWDLSRCAMALNRCAIARCGAWLVREHNSAFVRKIEKLNTKSPLLSSSRKTPPAALTNCRRLTSDIGVGLQAFGVGVALAAQAANPRRGRGAYQSLESSGALPPGVSLRDFFWSGEVLNIFPKSNNSKRSHIRCPREGQAFSNAYAKPCIPFFFSQRSFAHLFSGRRGAIKSARFSCPDRVARTHFREISKTFFVQGGGGWAG
jgi:hypothetical protein